MHTYQSNSGEVTVMSWNEYQRKKKMEKIEVNAEFLFELKSKQEWVNKIPNILPDKKRAGESWIWLDKNNNVFERGADFMAAETNNTYPCRVYRLNNVNGAYK